MEIISGITDFSGNIKIHSPKANEKLKLLFYSDSNTRLFAQYDDCNRIGFFATPEAIIITGNDSSVLYDGKSVSFNTGKNTHFYYTFLGPVFIFSTKPEFLSAYDKAFKNTIGLTPGISGIFSDEGLKLY